MDYLTIDKLKSKHNRDCVITYNYPKIRKWKILNSFRKVPKDSVKKFYELMKKGPDWLYEELAIYQPQTASILKNNPIYLCSLARKGIVLEHVSLLQVINGRIIRVSTYYDEDCYESDKSDLMTLWKSLPEALQKAYFYKFDGLQMFFGDTFHAGGAQLINRSGRTLRVFLEEIGKKEKYLEKCYEFFDIGPNYLYSKPYLNGCSNFDDQGSRLQSFLEYFHQEPRNKNHDYLCVLKDNEKSPIYYFKDGNLDNLYEIPRATITEAIDDYHYHILSGAENRFQFLDYAHEVKEWKKPIKRNIKRLEDKKMTEMTPLVRSYFESAGWFEGRDVSDSFKFPEGKFISDKALDLMKQFAYLKVAYRCCMGDGFIYFYSDDSEASKTLRRDADQQFFKYLSNDTPCSDIYNGNKYAAHWETENLEGTSIAIEKAGIKLTRIGMIVDLLEIEILIDERGGVWLDGNEKTDDNFIEFCNSIMTGEKPLREEYKAWYNRGLNK